MVGALKHYDTFFALKRPAQQITGKWAEHGDIDHADLKLTKLGAHPQIVGHRLSGDQHAALTDNQIVGIICTVLADTVITAAGELVELLHRLFGDGRNVIKEIGALCRHRLHIGILILYTAGGHRIIDIPNGRNAPALVTVQHLLCGCRGIDNVIGTPQILPDQLTLRHLNRLDEVGGQKSILRHDAGNE